MISKPHLTLQEWRWAISWSVAILLLSCLPYLIALQLAPEGWQFAGFLTNPLDGHSYLAKMRQGYLGNWLFHLTYTPEPHQGAFIFTFYLALGHLAGLTRLPLIWLFHLARLAAGFLLLLVAFRFIALVTPHSQERRLAFLFILTASGFGWVGVILGAFPIDLWVPEAFVPYSLYANPHFPLGIALMLVIFQLVVWPPGRAELANRDGNEVGQLSPPPTNEQTNHPTAWLPVLWPGLAALALALILPFALLTVWAVLSVFLGWLCLSERRLPWPRIWPTVSVALFSAPVIAYDIWVSTTHPIMAGWGAQNVTEAPSIPDFLLGYGLVGLLAVLGSWLIIRTSKPETERSGEWLVLCWAVTTIILVYLPLDLQRRLINGLHVPLCILAAIGLQRWLESSSLKAGQRRLLTTGVVATGLLGTLFVWLIPLVGMLSPPEESEITALFFWRDEEKIALNWLREYATSEAVILASPRVGMFVPGQTGARAYYGHPFETIEAEEKREMAEAYFRGEIEHVSPDVDFIFYGPSERALGQPAGLADYPLLFSAGDVTVYGVKE